MVFAQEEAPLDPVRGQADRRDLPDAEIHLPEAGHFALETHGDDIARLIGAFLERQFPDASV